MLDRIRQWLGLQPKSQTLEQILSKDLPESVWEDVKHLSPPVVSGLYQANNFQYRLLCLPVFIDGRRVLWVVRIWKILDTGLTKYVGAVSAQLIQKSIRSGMLTYLEKKDDNSGNTPRTSDKKGLDL